MGLGLSAPARDFLWKFEMVGPWVRPSWMEPITDLAGLIQAIEEVPANDLLIVAAYDCIYGHSAIGMSTGAGFPMATSRSID